MKTPLLVVDQNEIKGMPVIMPQIQKAIRYSRVVKNATFRSFTNWFQKVIVLGGGTLVFAIHSFAETSCGGASYANDPNCGGVNVNCTIANCQDVSMNQDGSTYQCCPPGAAELPEWAGPAALGILLTVLLVWRKKKYLSLPA